MPEGVTCRRVPRKTSSGDFTPGDFAWHPPAEGEEERHSRILWLALPVTPAAKQRLREGGWERPPAVWFASCPVVRGPPPATDGVWGWDGDATHPTLTPSILCSTAGVYGDPDSDPAEIEVWHGFMQAGTLRRV